ncbi:hypothetical protein [Zhongshania sp.]|uniref:hypothetical protein n=1 Tax=Zhongshania sp. TaxID=1971902 RepID=UPI003562939A
MKSLTIAEQLVLSLKDLNNHDLVQDIPREELLHHFAGEKRDRFNGLLPLSLFDALDDRAFDERRTKTEVVILALLLYFQEPMIVKPSRSSRRARRVELAETGADE